MKKLTQDVSQIKKAKVAHNVVKKLTKKISKAIRTKKPVGEVRKSNETPFESFKKQTLISLKKQFKVHKEQSLREKMILRGELYPNTRH